MARRVDDKIIRAPKRRTGSNGPTKAEDRTILAAALASPGRGAFAEVLASMPDVGVDADFERVDSVGRSPQVFD
jgi:plasmid stability protein